MRKIIITAVSVLIILALGVAFFRCKCIRPHLPLECTRILQAGFEQWWMTERIDANKDRYYPNVGGNSRESFTLIVPYIKGGENTLRNYGYVPGLRTSDPRDLILMYYKQRTKFLFHMDCLTPFEALTRKPGWIVIPPGDEPGTRTPGILDAEGSDWIDASEFIRRLQATLDFLKENNRPNWENVAREQTEFLNSIKQ